MDLPTVIAKTWPYVVVAAPGIYAVIKDLLGRRALARKAEADLMQMAQDAASGVIHTLREEAERLAQRLEQVEAELGDLRREHSRMILDKDARIALLEGEKRQLEAKVSAYRRVLAAHGLADEPSSQHFEVAAGDKPVVTPAAVG
ncbi:hypothetical protein [uncultured Caulobacter sp.]|uniref:hypothetical protein n=1 Tax=uncultured Caulobacter sp. TaxID=158749 RepID=UPI00263763AA|nr:hypothetical protein [uncultured Caulobacter sp.]